MRISDWSSDVCSSDLLGGGLGLRRLIAARKGLDRRFERAHAEHLDIDRELFDQPLEIEIGAARAGQQHAAKRGHPYLVGVGRKIIARVHIGRGIRSEEHTSELQSLMRISYAVFCLNKKNKN